jgi:hypothetical protein
MLEKDSNDLNGNGQRFSIVARGERSAEAIEKEAPPASNLASPCRSSCSHIRRRLTVHQTLRNSSLSLITLWSRAPPPPIALSSDKGKRKKMSKNDEFWEGVLESERRRLLNDRETFLTPVEAMMVGGSSDEDDVPIAQTLAKQSNGLSMLATLAAQPTPSPIARKKKAKKSLWTYETVAEPTGISSRYLDADTPTERATQRRAKEKLSAIHEPDGNSSGALPPA